MASKEESTNVSLILEAIVKHNSSTLKLMLKACQDEDISSWKDENSFDLIHHSILENNKVAFFLLFNHSCFQSGYGSFTWPYLHLAACLGYKDLVLSIAYEVKYHNDSVFLNWYVYNRVIKPKMKIDVPELKPEDYMKSLSPIDVAARFGHTRCLYILLGAWEMFIEKLYSRKIDNTKTHYLSLASAVNSPLAIKLVVNSGNFDKKVALKCALKHLATECVEYFLDDVETDVQKVFHGMNMYHFLYSGIYLAERCEAMVKITSLLIKHKRDVNACLPLRTFPLYGLLSQRMNCIAEENRYPFLVACLKLLLKAGADPNINEFEMEKNDPLSVLSTALGRMPYSSAIHCFLGNIWYHKASYVYNALVHDPIAGSACQVIKMLFKYKANINFVGHFMTPMFNDRHTKAHLGTALHLLLATRTQLQISCPVLIFLLQNGLDADTEGSWYMPGTLFTIQYALNVLPFSLWSVPVKNSAKTSQTYFMQQDLQIFTYIMKFMSQPALIMAYREFLHGVQFLRKSAEHLGGLEILEKSHLQGSDFFAEIVNEYEIATTQPWRLQRYCRHVVWKESRIRVENVHDLHIPGPLKTIKKFGRA